MNDTHIQPQAICELGHINLFDFNARKTQCCLLTHKGINIIPSSVDIGGGVKIIESK